MAIIYYTIAAIFVILPALLPYLVNECKLKSFKSKFKIIETKNDSDIDVWRLHYIESGNYVDIEAIKIKEIEADVKEWFYFIHTIISVLSISFAIGIQGTHNIFANGMIATSFILMTYIYGHDRFPKRLRSLRNKTDDRSVYMRLVLEKRYLGIRAMLKVLPPMALSYGYLIFSTLAPILVEHAAMNHEKSNFIIEFAKSLTGV